jgi:hypothetical protein
MTYARRLLPIAAAFFAVAALTSSVPSAGAAPPDLTPSATAGGTYHPLTPTRILDTRGGLGPVPGDGTIDFQVTGQGGVPTSGVGSVVVNLTAVDPTSEGFLSLYAGGLPKPTAANPSSLNFRAGQNVANMAITTLNAGGVATVFNAFGNTHVLVDVVGWYDLTGSGGGRYNPIAPSRIMDTRNAVGPVSAPLSAGTSVNLDVTGFGGVPASGVSAVVVNLTATETTSAGFLTVFPQAATRPDVSNLNFTANATRANLVTVGVNPSNGLISIYNAFGNTHVIVDVMGWYDQAGTTGSLFHATTPTRVADTRPVNAPLQPGVPAGITFPGQPDVPSTGVTGIAINVTATDPTGGGFMTVYPSDIAVPDVSNLNWPGPGTSTPNLALVRLPANGEVSFVSPLTTVHVLVDVVGYFSAS